MNVDELSETIAKLEQKLANRDLLLERVEIWLKGQAEVNTVATEFLIQLKKHKSILSEVER